MSFSVTLSTVVVMLLYCLPGYLLVRFRKVPQGAISSFAIFLVYVCAPIQILYAMTQIEYTPYIAKYLLISFALSLLLITGMLGLTYLVFRKRQPEVPYRICVCAAALGNVGFMGLPLLEALMPEYPQMQVFASMFFLTLNIVMWSLGSCVVTRDRRYISLRKALINPSSIAVMVGLVICFGHVHLPNQLTGMIELMGRMATPMCMIILGMRLGTVPFKSIFTSRVQYIAILLKQVAFPLMALAILSLLPLERDYIRGVYVLCCVPVGNLVLSFAEMLGEGQDVAANVVLLSTILSMVTIPAMLLLI